jgi:protein-L-isoaspartate(D-aspartate) O-methyltransferase
MLQKDNEKYERLRRGMVETQIVSRGVSDERVLEAMLKVQRHFFVDEKYRDIAYSDRPLSIGEGQTISQPYIVAFMSEVLKLTKTDKVLEIGAGSGYQAAILAELAKEVYSVEIIESLLEKTKESLKNYHNITLGRKNGYEGWSEYAPFNAIIVTCAAPFLPQTLVGQLAEGGRMIIPVGRGFQELIFLKKEKDGIKQDSLMPVVFVPMVRSSKNSEDLDYTD